MKWNKLDGISIGSTAAAVIGLILALVGCLVLSVQQGIGVNLSLSPVVYVGVVLIVASLAGAITANVLFEKNPMNRAAATVALYAAVLALMIVIALVAYTILIPVLHPSNG